MKISEKFAKQDNYIVQKFSRHEVSQNKMLSRQKLPTVTTFLNIESRLKSELDKADAVTSLVQGLVSTPVVNVQSNISSDFDRLVEPSRLDPRYNSDHNIGAPSVPAVLQPFIACFQPF